MNMDDEFERIWKVAVHSKSSWQQMSKTTNKFSPDSLPLGREENPGPSDMNHKFRVFIHSVWFLTLLSLALILSLFPLSVLLLLLIPPPVLFLCYFIFSLIFSSLPSYFAFCSFLVSLLAFFLLSSFFLPSSNSNSSFFCFFFPFTFSSFSFPSLFSFLLFLIHHRIKYSGLFQVLFHATCLIESSTVTGKLRITLSPTNFRTRSGFRTGDHKLRRITPYIDFFFP